jgi:hypothetical protein
VSCATVETRQDRLELLNRLEKNTERRTAVSGNLMVTSELNGQSVSVPAVLLASFPDKFRLEVQDPVGGLLALVVVNGENFWLFESERKEILTGPLSRIPFPLIPKGSSEELVRYFLARPYMERVRKGDLSESRSVLRVQPSRETLEWDSVPEPVLWKRELGGKTQIKAEYEDYEAKDGLRYPTKLRLTGLGHDGRQRQVLLVWKDWQPSVPDEQKLFQIPQQQTFGRKIKALP